MGYIFFLPRFFRSLYAGSVLSANDRDVLILVSRDLHWDRSYEDPLGRIYFSLVFYLLLVL